MKKIITYFFLGCFSYVVSSCSDLAFGDSFLEKAPGFLSFSKNSRDPDAFILLPSAKE